MNKLAPLLGSLAALGLLAACVSSVATLDPETQAACIREAGITGAYSVTTTQFDDRITYVVGPGPGVRQSQTDIANACIARRIGGGQPGAPAAAPKATRPAPTVGASCERGGSIFQGGASYC